MPLYIPPGAGGALTNPMTTTGDLIVGGAAGVPARLGIGSATQLLHGGTTPGYSAIATADIAANAVTTTTSASTSSSTSSTTLVALGSQLAFTAAGGVCYFTFVANISQTVAGGLEQIAYRLDGGADQYIHYTVVAINALFFAGAEFRLNNGVALTGAHTIDLVYAVSAGTFLVSPINFLVREFKR